MDFIVYWQLLLFYSIIEKYARYYLGFKNHSDF